MSLLQTVKSLICLKQVIQQKRWRLEVLLRLLQKSVVTEEIFGEVERTVREYEEEGVCLKQLIEQKSRKLKLLLQPVIKLHRAVKPVTKPGQPAHICATCNKQFKNSYTLRRHQSVHAHICATCNKQFKNSYTLLRHQSVHTGIKMKSHAAREKEEGGKGGGGRLERQTVPLSLIHLSLPPPLPPPPAPPAPAVTEPLPQDIAHCTNVQPVMGQPVMASIAPATVTMAVPTQPLQAAVVILGCMEQACDYYPNPNHNSNQVRKNHACEACGKAFGDVYHLTLYRVL